MPGILNRLFRTRLASLVALSALCGFLFAAQNFSAKAVPIFLAIWLLAAGCSALNQLQEIQIDSRMQRTRNRPLPAGELTPSEALLIASLMLASGLGLLLTTGCGDDDSAGSTPPNPSTEPGTIAEVATEAGSFQTLLTAVDAAGLTATLNGAGPFTVFAPTDDAFAALPAGALDALLADSAALTEVLTYHVVAGNLMAGLKFR